MPNSDDQLPDEEIARRMERGLRRALNTPPQRHGKNPRSPPLPKDERPASIEGESSQGQDTALGCLALLIKEDRMFADNPEWLK
jgi:hypothetical protein